MRHKNLLLLLLLLLSLLLLLLLLLLFCCVLRRYVSQNIVAITETLRLNRFTLLYVFKVAPSLIQEH